jgi:F-type H+-transporting ATPase subunit a
MGLEFLTRVRRTAFGAALFIALYAAVYSSYGAGLGFGAGALWSLLQLWLLEKIVVALTARGEQDGRGRRVAVPAVAHVLMLGVGAFLLMRLPAAWLAAGFTLPFAIILLKTVSRMLLESRAWKSFISSRWKPALALAAVLAGLWFLATTHRVEATPTHATTVAATEGGHEGAPAAEGHAAEGEHAATGEHGEGGHAQAEAGPKKFDTVMSILVKKYHGTPLGDFLHKYEILFFSFFVAIVLSVIAFLATRAPKMVPGPLQNVVEAVVDTVYTQICDILGPKYGPKYVPFLGSLFIYIFAMNLFGIVPLMESPTSSLNVTLALALTVFVYVQYSAIKESGPLGYLDHLAGMPRTAVEWALVPLLFPIHVIGELAKPVSLSCRLFGNIFGEDMLLVGFATLGIGAMAAMGLGNLPFGLPIHFIFLFLALLTSFVQAMVFSMLSTIYFLLMLPHDHGHDHDHGHGEEAHHHAH